MGKILKEDSFLKRAVVDMSIKWVIEIGCDYLYAKYKKILKPKKEGKWNNEICKIGNETIYEVINIMYGKEDALAKLALVADLFFSMADEPETPIKYSHIEQMMIKWKVGSWYRGAKHLIWSRADRGCWNRPLVEECWEKLHEAVREICEEEGKPPEKYFGLMRIGIDFSMLIADDDDPYYTMLKWWLCKVRDKGMFELAKNQKLTDNKLFNCFVLWLRKMDTDKIKKLGMDWNTDICEVAAKGMTKKDIIIGGPIEEKRKLARKNCPL